MTPRTTVPTDADLDAAWKLLDSSEAPPLPLPRWPEAATARAVVRASIGIGLAFAVFGGLVLRNSRTLGVASLACAATAFAAAKAVSVLARRARRFEEEEHDDYDLRVAKRVRAIATVVRWDDAVRNGEIRLR